MSKETNKQKQSEQKPKKSFVGEVLVEFKRKGVTHAVGTKYDAQDEFSYNYLRNLKKIK